MAVAPEHVGAALVNRAGRFGRIARIDVEVVVTVGRVVGNQDHLGGAAHASRLQLTSTRVIHVAAKPPLLGRGRVHGDRARRILSGAPVVVAVGKLSGAAKQQAFTLVVTESGVGK